MDLTHDQFIVHRTRRSVQDLLGEVGCRTAVDSTGWQRVVGGLGFRHRVSSQVFLPLGVRALYTVPREGANTLEIRPWQGLSGEWPSFVTHLVRLEERFVFNTETWDSSNSLRLRYRAKVSHRWHALREGRFLHLFLSAEVFLTLMDQENAMKEKVRTTLGLERSFNPALAFIVEMNWEHSGSYRNSQSQDTLFLRLRLMQSIS